MRLIESVLSVSSAALSLNDTDKKLKSSFWSRGIPFHFEICSMHWYGVGMITLHANTDEKEVYEFDDSIFK